MVSAANQVLLQAHCLSHIVIVNRDLTWNVSIHGCLLYSEGEARLRVALWVEPKMASSMMQPRTMAVAVHSQEATHGSVNRIFTICKDHTMTASQ